MVIFPFINEEISESNKNGGNNTNADEERIEAGMKSTLMRIFPRRNSGDGREVGMSVFMREGAAAILSFRNKQTKRRNGMEMDTSKNIQEYFCHSILLGDTAMVFNGQNDGIVTGVEGVVINGLS